MGIVLRGIVDFVSRALSGDRDVLFVIEGIVLLFAIILMVFVFKTLVIDGILVLFESISESITEAMTIEIGL
ncbi:MAG: hypothetical protein K0R54_256 [Clostridiaceae bacterium]|jgi:hypothetical protein|nr:hypothetical protein [Clostridiaceae bacterium]